MKWKVPDPEDKVDERGPEKTLCKKTVRYISLTARMLCSRWRKMIKNS